MEAEIKHIARWSRTRGRIDGATRRQKAPIHRKQGCLVIESHIPLFKRQERGTRTKRRTMHTTDDGNRQYTTARQTDSHNSAYPSKPSPVPIPGPASVSGWNHCPKSRSKLISFGGNIVLASYSPSILPMVAMLKNVGSNIISELSILLADMSMSGPDMMLLM